MTKRKRKIGRPRKPGPKRIRADRVKTSVSISGCVVDEVDMVFRMMQVVNPRQYGNWKMSVLYRVLIGDCLKAINGGTFEPSEVSEVGNLGKCRRVYVYLHRENWERLERLAIMFRMYRAGVLETYLLKWLRELRNTPHFQRLYPGYRSPLA